MILIILRLNSIKSFSRRVPKYVERAIFADDVSLLYVKISTSSRISRLSVSRVRRLKYGRMIRWFNMHHHLRHARHINSQILLDIVSDLVSSLERCV